MAYEPVNWKNRVVERPRTYHIQNNPDGTVTLIPAPGQVYEEGTPVDALHLNKMEQGLITHLADYAQHGVTMGHENDLYVVKIVSLFRFTPLEANYGGDIRAIVTDDEFIYVGGWTTRTVRKLRKSGLLQVAESAAYGGDIYAIAADDEFIYVGGGTTRTVRKLRKSNLSQVAESANYGGSIYAIATDDEFIYVGGGTTRTVRKLRKSGLSQVAESAAYGGDIYAIAADDEFIYVGGTITQTVRVIENRDLIKIIRRYQ